MAKYRTLQVEFTHSDFKTLEDYCKDQKREPAEVVNGIVMEYFKQMRLTEAEPDYIS